MRVLAEDLHREIARLHVSDPDRNHKLRVGALATHDVAEGEFLGYAWLAVMLGHDDDLFDRLVRQHMFDLVPEVVATPKRANVDPELVRGSIQAAGEPPGDPVVLAVDVRGSEWCRVPVSERQSWESPPAECRT